MDFGLKIIDRYIIKKFILTFFIALLLIIGIVIIIDLSENIDYFVKYEAPLRAIIFDYYLNYIPYFINMFSPLFVRLSPKKKFQDSLYDTDMVNTPNIEPDPTMATSAKVTPAFVDDIVLGDEDYKPAINSDIFNAIKEDRKVVAETDGGTKAFDKFENISSSGSDLGETKLVGNIKNVSDNGTGY